MQNEIGRLRKKFRQERAELFHADAATLPCREFFKRHTSLVDSIVSDIHRYSCSFADRETRRTRRSGLAIVATGGYGRMELNPFSDIDIAFIPSEEEDPWVEAAVHMAFKLVMDVFLSFREIRVGYSFRPVAEVSTWDLPTLTALLDARHICGDVHLSETLADELRKHLSPLDLLRELRREMSRWGTSFPLSLYSVEPNLKEGPGSLRDLHRARWIYKLLIPQDGGSLMSMLGKLCFLAEGRIQEIEAASDWLWNARNWMHLVTGKRSDVLMTNYQDRIARELGGTSAQEWLASHYLHAEVLALFRDSAMRRMLQGPIELNEVLLERGQLHLNAKSEAGLAGSPVRLFQLSQQYAIPLSPVDLDALEGQRLDARQIRIPGAEEAWAFLGILNGEQQVCETLRALIRVGMMERFVKDYSLLMRQVPPDPAHSFTIGAHSLKIIEHLEALREGRDTSVPRFCELINRCAHFDVLCLAALLHDSGKILSAPDHSEAAMDLTRSVAQNLGLPPEKRELLETLVLQHLLLVRTARLQDLKSPGVIHNVAERVKNIDALRHLYVFTFADTRAVSEKSWTSMDYRNLEDLYSRVQNLLTGQSRDGSDSAAIENRIGEIRRKLAGFGPLDERAVQRHCDSMPSSYVLNTPLDEIAIHIQLMQRLEAEKVVLDIYNRPGDDYSELTVCTFDDPRPGMLAKITGVLYGCNIDIHKAQVFTLEKERPVVLDTLWIRAGGLQISEIRAARLRSSLRDVLVDTLNIEQFLRAAGKQPPAGILLDSLELRNDLSEEHTVVHVVARDLQGLLYLMTRTLSRAGLHIHSARVATWNARAENNFYVTTLTGSQIAETELPQWRENLRGMFRGVTGD